MYRYKYNSSYHHKSRKARRSVVLASLVVFAVIGAGAYVAVDVLKQVFNKQAPTSQTTFSSVQGASVNVFRTQYFQFQADDTWKEIASENHDGHYVYSSFKGTLVVRNLTIEVNRDTDAVPALVRTTNVMPISIDAAGRLIPQGDAGDHCGTLMPKNSKQVPTEVTQRQVKFICTPDAILYQVVVGVIGGNTNIQLARPGGGKASYTITYKDLTVSPLDTPLRNILLGFQAL